MNISERKDEIKMTNMNMEAAIIFDSFTFPDALRQALIYAGDDGFVASLPQLLHARANADYDNIIWNTWFTTNSEESVVTTKAWKSCRGGDSWRRHFRFAGQVREAVPFRPEPCQ